MSKTKLNAPIYFSTSYEGVDTEAKVIKGIVLAQEGEAKGHGVQLNRKFIRDVVTKGKAKGDVGVKCRFGHPNMCSNALGTYLGRYKNFRLKTNVNDESKPFQALADLYLDESSKITPNGNLSEYVLKLAATDPGAFGNSIVFRAGESEVMQEDDGQGGTTEVEYATIEELYESDLVDSPAATNSLFSELAEGELAYLTTNFLDENPEIFDVVMKNPSIIDEFMHKYTQYKDIKNQKNDHMEKFDKAIEKLEAMFDKFKSLFEEKPVELKEGDSCTTPDGETGTMKLMPDGSLSCEIPENEAEIEIEMSLEVKEKIAAFESEIALLKASQVNETKLQEFKDFVAEAKAIKEELSAIKSTWTPPAREGEFEADKKLSRMEILEQKLKAKKESTK